MYFKFHLIMMSQSFKLFKKFEFRSTSSCERLMNKMVVTVLVTMEQAKSILVSVTYSLENLRPFSCI